MAYGLGLVAPSLALMGIFRELDLVGTGNGGFTISLLGTSGALGLRDRLTWAAVPLDFTAQIPVHSHR